MARAEEPGPGAGLRSPAYPAHLSRLLRDPQKTGRPARAVVRNEVGCVVGTTQPGEKLL